MNVMLQTILAKPSSQRTPAPPPGLRAWKQKNIGKSSSFFLSYSKLFNTFQFQRWLFAKSLVCRFDAAVVAVVLVVSLPWKQALEKREARQSKSRHGTHRDDTTSRHHIYKRIDVQHDSRGLQCDSHGPYSVLVTLVTLALSSRRVLRPCRERLKNFMI